MNSDDRPTYAQEFALAQLRHLYRLMIEGQVKDTAEAARGLLGPAIEKLEGNSDDRIPWYPQCGEPLPCGGECARPPGHEGPHLCPGDDWCEPGSCPA